VEFGSHVDGHPALLRHVAPARAREIDDLDDQLFRSTGINVSWGSRWR